MDPWQAMYRGREKGKGSQKLESLIGWIPVCIADISLVVGTRVCALSDAGFVAPGFCLGVKDI